MGELTKKPSECSLYSEDVTRINFSPSGQELYPVYNTNGDLRRTYKVCARALEAAGVEKGDICAVTFGYHLFIAGLFYQNQLEYYGAKVIPLGPGESDRAIDIINRYDVSVLISNPTFAMKLAAGGIPSIKILFVGGEPFSSVEGYKEKVQNAFGGDLTIIDSYGMAACMTIARSCRYDTGLHIMDDFVYAEVIDPVTGKSVPHGEKGELVLTHLNKEAAPLLRYRTGDLTFMEQKACACGRNITLPRGVLGRTDEMLKIKGVKFWPSQIGPILYGFPEFTNRYRLVVSEVKGVDRLELSVEGDKRAKDKIEELSRRLKQETLLAFNEIVIVDKLEEGPILVDRRERKAF
ncbi:MAG: hypothetical protein B1H11_11275 [Desulfobacteraceae bacterium 4484_190.1]|nr:MAG: hypothetical protein B1H11_11275 [Desulfobacteraceae bacterium 4484_190.1]